MKENYKFKSFDAHTSKILTFAGVYIWIKILKCDHSNESSRVTSSCGMVVFKLFKIFNLGFSQQFSTFPFIKSKSVTVILTHAWQSQRKSAFIS